MLVVFYMAKFDKKEANYHNNGEGNNTNNGFGMKNRY